MMTERWVPVVGHSKWEVSTEGRVRSWCRNRWGRADTPRMLDPGMNHQGYPRVNIAGSVRLLHHVVLEAFVGPRPPGHHAAHKDGNPANPRLDNLYWATPKQNASDKYRHGTIPVGESHAGAKLTDNLVRWMRAEHRTGRASADIAREIGVAQSCAYNAIHGRTWGHVE